VSTLPVWNSFGSHLTTDSHEILDLRIFSNICRQKIQDLIKIRNELGGTVHEDVFTLTWTYNKVRELIAVKVLHTSLLNTTVVACKVLPLGSYAPMPAPSLPLKTILELVL